MKIFGYLLVAVALALSLAALIHDIRRLRISHEEPQAAPSRIAPEVHAVAAIIGGIGLGLARGWLIGTGGALLFALVIYLIVRPLINRL